MGQTAPVARLSGCQAFVGTNFMAQRPGKNRDAAASRGEGRNVADGGDRDADFNERRRLTTLRDYHILDTRPEPTFARVTTLLAALFEGPLALISFVADPRPGVKSRHG